MKKRLLITLTSLWFFLGLAGQSFAVPIGFSVDTTSNTLYSIDLATGVGTAIGTGLGAGFSDVEGLAFSGTGILFGIDDVMDQLVTISTTTGLATVVGSLGVNFSEAGLGFTSDGTLFAASDLGDNGVYTVDTGTGAATFLSTAGPDAAGLAGDSTGALFGVSDDCSGFGGDCLVSVNTTTGVATQIGGGLGVSVDEAGLAFDASDTLYLLDRNLNNVFTINTATGVATAGAALSPSLDFEGLAINNATPVPEPSTVILFGSGLFGLVARRRFKKHV